MLSAVSFIVNVHPEISSIAFAGVSVSNDRYNTPSLADTRSKRVISTLPLSHPNIDTDTLSLNEQSTSDTVILA